MIQFNNIPTTIRTPGAYVEIDNSRALKGLVQNPHKALIIGQGLSTGTKPHELLYAISRDGLADSYFGTGSPIARMCNIFKENNPNTELYAIAVSISATAAGVKASAGIAFSTALSTNGGSCGGAGTLYMYVNGTEIPIAITSGWSVEDVQSHTATTINLKSAYIPCIASNGGSKYSDGEMVLIAKYSGSIGNALDVRVNYYDWQSLPAAFSGDSIYITNFAGGTSQPDIDPVWDIVGDEQFHYIVMPYDAATQLTSLEDELDDRFGPMIDMQGHGFCATRGTNAACTTLGNTRNNQHNTIIGYYDAPQDPCEWAAALAAVAAKNLNNDPARPLHGLKLKGILPPPKESRFTRAERDVLLYDGIATFTVARDGSVQIERCITTYQTNSVGGVDPSYLDIQTLATLNEIRYQYKTRMLNRFIAPRFKLADDTFPVQPGSYVATPNLVKQECIALFTLLRDEGLIENLDEFVENIVVERNTTDRNRVDVLLPPDLINQFIILATNLQFIL